MFSSFLYQIYPGVERNNIISKRKNYVLTQFPFVSVNICRPSRVIKAMFFAVPEIVMSGLDETIAPFERCRNRDDGTDGEIVELEIFRKKGGRR